MRKIFLISLLTCIVGINLIGCTKISSDIDVDEGTDSIIDKDINVTGSFNNMGLYENGYYIEINSSKAGHPNGDSFFSSYFDCDIGSIDYSFYWFEEDVKDEYSNFNKLKKVSLDGKEFKYILNDDDGITLIYKVDDKNYFTIELEAPSEFDDEGNFTGEVIPLDEDIFDTKGFKKFVKFDIEKDEVNK